jgi:recA bacterial DNA recombination protein.
MSKEQEAKMKALQLTLDKLDKTYGKGAVMKMGDTIVQDVEVISSGVYRAQCRSRGTRLPKGKGN